MKKIIMIAMLSMLIVLTACGEERKQVAIEEKSNDNKIFIYHPSGSGIAANEGMYQVKQPDSPSAAVEEVIKMLGLEQWGMSIVYHTYMLDATNNLSLDFSVGEMPDVKTRLLCNAAICQTIFQLSDIQGINIRYLHETEDLIQENSFTRDSFYFYGYEDETMNIREIAIYYPNKEGTTLSRGIVKVRQTNNESLVEQIIGVLASRGVIPSDTTINEVYFSSGICYVDLDEAFVDTYPSVEGKLVIYAMTNSITELDGVDSLFILVNGKPIKNYHGFDDVNKALSFDATIVK